MEIYIISTCRFESDFPEEKLRRIILQLPIIYTSTLEKAFP